MDEPVATIDPPVAWADGVTWSVKIAPALKVEGHVLQRGWAPTPLSAKRQVNRVLRALGFPVS